ncbi:MAG: HIT family protein [Tannerella sp.]|jgi:diadenosine tetraphosphate (Ap4A) HIT family hydrolase|nr:HIT family protein [Tannerella sp.]
MENKKEGCNYCAGPDSLTGAMLKIADLPYSTVYLLKNQLYRGRCIVAYHQHATEYFELEPTEGAGFFADISRTAHAVYNVFKPQKINYATYGDLFPHVHVHIVPKREGVPHWGVPFQDEPKEFLSDAEYAEIIEKIRAEL